MVPTTDPGGFQGAPGTLSNALVAPGRSPRRSGIDFGAIFDIDSLWFFFASKMSHLDQFGHDFQYIISTFVAELPE